MNATAVPMDVNVTLLQKSEDNGDTKSSFSIENHIWIYTSPLLVLMAVIGNILTIIVMSRPRMIGSSTSVYLQTLAVGDMLVVVIGLVPEWLGQMGIVEIWNLHPWVCKTELYLYYTALDFSIWILVAFVCDRVIAVRFPLKKHSISTPRNAVIVSVLIFLAANLNAHVFWTRGAQYKDEKLMGNCRWLNEYFVFESAIRPWIVLSLALIGPFLVIAFCNLVILCTMKEAKKMRNTLARGSMQNKTTSRRVRGSYSQTTIMCMFNCLAFMLLVLPNIILLIGKESWSRGNPAYWHARAVAGQLVYINHSINFILYAVTGSRFRKELATLVKKSDRKSLESSSSFRTKAFSMSASATQNDGESKFS